jgi:phage shock protein A
MRTILIALPFLMIISSCTDNDSLQNQGQRAGAAADSALERIGNKIDTEQDRLDNRAATVNERARDVRDEIKADVKKVDNAVDAAAAELRK